MTHAAGIVFPRGRTPESGKAAKGAGAIGVFQMKEEILCGFNNERVEVKGNELNDHFSVTGDLTAQEGRKLPGGNRPLLHAALHPSCWA